jgi:alpha-D-ribose 1-methylphosphonate 5-triphosphate diphosphatase
MSLHLPPLRLTGARILRNGLLQRRSLGLARGRIAKGPLPEIDLTGHLVLPGIIDLHLALPGPLRLDALPAIKSRLAAKGVTTAWLTVPSDPDPLIDQVLDRLATIRGGVDLRAKLILSPDARLTPERLRQLEEQRLDFACFTSRTRLTTADAGAPSFPRDLCRMAECFDTLGIPYGSLGDADAETREYYRMLGARLAELPRSRAAAATARAMGDSVLAPAKDLNPAASIGDAISTARLVAQGLCDALVSNGSPGAMAEAAWILANGALKDLPAAWALISSKPAEIIGLADRGALEYGKRADLVIVHEKTRAVVATIAKGRLCFATRDLAARFGQSGQSIPMAAE